MVKHWVLLVLVLLSCNGVWGGKLASNPPLRRGYGHMVGDYYVEKLRTLHRARRETLARLQTREDVISYRNYVRQVLKKTFPTPPRVPLQARVTGVLHRPFYRIEKVCFASRPNFWVTANLYVPKQISGRAPAVLGLCGHAATGKACDSYQAFAIRLVRNGFVVLIVDPIQQGERQQYVKLNCPLGMAETLWGAHNVIGKQLDLIGESFAAWRVWDARCGLDYLLSRPEVDSRYIGVTGNSGGGTLTEWTFARDERVTMAAPSCHVTTFLHNLENELPTDAEQNPPGILGAGLEMADLFIAQAPKPVILLGQKYDFFDRRGTRETFEELRRIYRLLGAEDKIAYFEGPNPHGYSHHNQEAMVDFFRKQCGMTGEQIKLTLQPQGGDPQLQVLPSGGVVVAGSTPIYELIARRAAELKRHRKLPPNLAAWRKCLTTLLQLPADRAIPYYRVSRPVRIERRLWARYAVETEVPGIRAILKKRMAGAPGRHNILSVEPEIHLFLPHVSSEEESRLPWVKNLHQGGVIYALDVRGLGESQPEEAQGGFLQSCGLDFMLSSYATMLDESYLGRRLYDVLRTLDLLTAHGAQKIHLHGNGQGAVLALLAAIMHDQVVSVTEHKALASYESCLQNVSDYPSSGIIRGVLPYFDLPDLRQAVQQELARRCPVSR